MKPAIEITDLSKKFTFGDVAPYLTLRDVLTNIFPTSLKKETNVEKDEFWALKDINLEVKRGEVLGVIGSNGAGKSTLLKILSRITPPSTGKVILRGKVGSLLEVGTGFHQELTGRENIYLNGAILGMTRSEIKNRFAEIVEFAEVQKFLDTPVKHYSSGMYVRLAFSVAAHMNCDILLIDEVLAVGDAQFQKKSMGKMANMTKEGRTILFVSHNMGAIKALCNKAVFLNKGTIAAFGSVDRVVETYLKTQPTVSDFSDLNTLISKVSFDTIMQIKDIGIYQKGKLTTSLLSDKPIEIEIKYEVFKEVESMRIYFDLIDSDENLLFRSFQDMNQNYPKKYKPGIYISKSVLPDNYLAPKDYTIKVGAAIHNVKSLLKEDIRIPISVTWGGYLNRAYPGDTIRGKLAPKLIWHTELIT
jgi:lipopolysaccharide transport system ATP-binding protein